MNKSIEIHAVGLWRKIFNKKEKVQEGKKNCLEGKHSFLLEYTSCSKLILAKRNNKKEIFLKSLYWTEAVQFVHWYAMSTYGYS